MVLATFYPSTIMLRLFCHIGQVQVKDGHLIKDWAVSQHQSPSMETGRILMLVKYILVLSKQTAESRLQKYLSVV